MSIAETGGPIGYFGEASVLGRRIGVRRGKDVLEPTALSALAAVLEASVMALFFLFCAAIYHFILRDTGPEYFGWTLYFAFAAALSVFYAGFTAHATSRFLSGANRRNIIPPALFGWTASFGAALLLAFLFGVVGDLSRVSITSAFVLGLPLALGVRTFGQAFISQQIADGDLRIQKIAVVGRRTDTLQFLLAGDLWRNGRSLNGTLYLEEIEQEDGLDAEAITGFAAMCCRANVETIVLAGDVGDLAPLQQCARELRPYALNVVYALTSGESRFDVLDTMPMGRTNTLRVAKKPLGTGDVVLKRLMDICAASAGLLLLSPLLLIVAALIKLDSPGPAIFKQQRRGFNGEAFEIYKFRSMRVMEPGSKMRQATRGDARITRLGRIIRATSIDELPQLLNVLKGDMSLVGPRPHALSHDDELNQQVEEYAQRQRIKPGITGWAQVNGYRGETKTRQQMAGRTQHDLFYIDNWSLLFDIWIVVLTVFSPATRRNAF